MAPYSSPGADHSAPKGFQKNIAVHTNPNHDLKVVPVGIPEPKEGEVLVHVKATGICGSDVHFWKHGRIGETMVVRGEHGLGHESAGIVVKLGPGVTTFKEGDRVAIEPGIPCSKPSCYYCRTGRYNACPNVKFHSTSPYHGTLTRYHAHPVGWLHRLPDNISFEEGALLEPLSVALAAVTRAELSLGMSTVICGAGPIGLVTLLCAATAGCEPLIITDLDQGRLEWAKRLVPRVHTIQVSRDDSPKQVAEKVKSLGGDEGIACALECTGVESSVSSAIYSVRFGGLVFVVGVGREFQNLPFMHLSVNEIDLKFQYRYNNTWPKAIRLVSAGLIDLKPLVTHRFQLEEAVKAFEIASDISKGSIKVQIFG